MLCSQLLKCGRVKTSWIRTPEKRRGAVGWGSSLYSFRITPDLGDNYTAYCLSHGNQTITFISLSTSCIQLPRWLKPLLPLVTNSAPNLHHERWILFRWLYSVSCRPGVFLAVHKLDTCLINDLTNIQSLLLVHFFPQSLRENPLFQKWQKYALKYRRIQHFWYFLLKLPLSCTSLKSSFKFTVEWKKKKNYSFVSTVRRSRCV